MEVSAPQEQALTRSFRIFWSNSKWFIAAAVLFIVLGSLFIAYAGLQTDEAMFAAPFFRDWRFFSLRIHHHDVPVMNMSYNGCLKTWLYAPLAALWHPVSNWAISTWMRLPMVLVGAVTIVLFGNLLAKLHSLRAAWVGCMLLVIDTSFLLTHVYDWGPVALQQLLTVTAMLLAVSWFQGGGNKLLAWAGFCCGLAFWDKAVFAWMFSGMLVGLLLTIRAIRPRITKRLAVIVLAAFCVGALPLIIYNFKGDPPFATIRSNAKLDQAFGTQLLHQRWGEFRSTLNGSILFGYIANEDSTPRPRGPRTALERASFSLRDGVGEHRRNLLVPALLLAGLLLPFLWNTRARLPMLFSLIAAAVAWIHMVLAGGGSVHHEMLLWPLPALFIAVAFAEASRRVKFGSWILAAIMGVLAVTGLLVTNQHLYQLIRNGAGDGWTDAIYPLAEGLKKVKANQIILIDWGLADSLVVVKGNDPLIRLSDDPLWSESYSAEQNEGNAAALANPNAIWVEHVPGHEIMKGVNERVLTSARHFGFEPIVTGTYNDSNGRPIFQTLRFHPLVACATCAAKEPAVHQ